jgi:hypothetical protein
MDVHNMLNMLVLVFPYRCAWAWTTANEWAAPTFVTPKKNGSVRFISDLRKLNAWLQRAPYPIPKIQDLLHKLESFITPHHWI